MLNTRAGHGIKLDLKSLAYKAKFIIYETENYQVPPADHTTTPLFESAGLMEVPPKEIISRTNSILIQIKIMQPELFPATAHSKFLFEAQFSRTDSHCRCKGEVQPLEFSSAGTFSFNSVVGCGFLDCFFQFNRPVTFRTSTNSKWNGGGNERYTNDDLVSLGIRYQQKYCSNQHSSVCECGCLELKAKKGLWKQLTSPDYPNHYCKLMKCKYLITAPQGCIVVANITELALEPNEDVLAIFDVPVELKFSQIYYEVPPRR
ncbi:Uncharacterized protein BM_BM3407 [Brugia malayi]|uniref:CUB domain-containing protein n=1 Tax=Brugia malayi TaxID=6279 RepID=A0A4E9EZ62_BRUMA|nr:Uncharacterized protein BM_BM3407 [Brugia malayi]VIO88976.1 Uncharacterized protein BM_BM3407 [Brugia malayi]